jgi:uncharacterized protein (DUF2147 family)
MRILVKASLLAAALAMSSAAAWADDASPVGLWKSVDDASGKPKALIRVTESNGVLQGKIEKLFRTPDQDQAPKCDKCQGANKDQPVIGMTMLSGLKKSGEEYIDGEITDPADGKVYRSKAWLTENGKKMQVRGYVGLPMFGRSQTWLRQE